MSNWLLEAEDEEEENQNNNVQNAPANTTMQPTTTNNNRNWLLKAEDEEEVEETVTTPVDIDYPNENVPLGIEPPNPNLFDQTVLEIERKKDEEINNYQYVFGRKSQDNIENMRDTYVSVREKVSSGDWGDTLLTAHRATAGVSTALTAGVITTVQGLFEGIPDAIGDNTELAVFALEKIFARDFRKGLGDAELTVGPYSRKTSNLFAYETPEKAADAFLDFLGAALIGTEKEPSLLEALPTGPATLFSRSFFGLDNKLQKLAKEEIKAQFKRANGQIKTLPNAQRIRFATQEELSKKQKASELIANENKKIRNELIIDFENKLSLNAGVLRESEDFRRISVEDADGNLIIDDGLSKEIGTDILNQFEAYAPITEKLNVESLTSPILNPDKLNGLVALTVDLQKQNKLKLDNNKTIIRNLEEAVIDGDLKTDQELMDMLNNYGLNFEDFVLTVVGSGSDAGRTLQKLSMIRKAAKSVSKEGHLKDKKLLKEHSVIYNNLRRIENIRRGGLVSQVATTVRNLTSATLIAGPDTIVNLIDNALWRYVDDINKSNGFVDKTFNSLIPIGVGKELVSPLMWKNSFRQLSLMFNDPKNSVEIMQMLLDRPEFASDYERMFIRLNEMGALANKKSKLKFDVDMKGSEVDFDTKFRGGQIADGVLSEMEDFVNVLNIPNRWQEHIIRSTYAKADLEMVLSREWKIDLMKELEDGNLLDIINSSSKFKPEGARSFVDILTDAIDGAMDVTFSDRPANPILADLSSLITRKLGTVLMPFPNFMFKSMERLATQIPIPTPIGPIPTALVKFSGPGMSKTRNPMFQILKSIVYKDGEQLTKDQRRLIGNNLVGLASLYGAYSYIKSDEAPADYKEIKLAADKYTDISPQYPLRAYLWAGKYAEEIEKGTGPEWFAEQWKSGEFAKTFAGSNLRVGSGNVIIETIKEIADAGAEGPSKTDQAGKLVGRLIANYVSTFIVPYNQVIESERAFGLRPANVMDTKGEAVTGFKENAIKSLQKPFKKYSFPATERARYETEYLFGKREKKDMFFGVLSGIKVTAPPDKEGEYLIDLGFEQFTLTSRTESAAGKRYETKFLNAYMKSTIVPQIMIQEDNLKNQGFDRKYIRAKLRPFAKTLFSSFRELSKEGRLNASGSFYKSLKEFEKIPAEIRKIAILEYKKSKGLFAEDPIDFNDEKVLNELVIRGKTERQILSKIKSAITK